MFGEVEQSPWGLRSLRTPSGGCLQGGKGVLNTLSSAGPPQQKTQNFIPVLAPLPFFSKMCAFTPPPHPPGPDRRVSILGAVRVSNFHFFQVFFQHSPRTPKNRLKFVARSLLSQLGRFWSPTWPPKRTQNPHFFGSKRQLMLKHAKTQNLPHFCFPWGPQNPPKIYQKSIPRGFYVKLVF